MMDITQTLLAKFAVKTSEQTGTPDAAVEEQLWAYRKAAALLHGFLPYSLNPVEPASVHNNPFLLLYEDIVSFSGGFAEGVYTLKQAIRTEALKKYGSRQQMYESLKANPRRIRTHLQELWEDYLNTGLFPSPLQLAYRQLIDLYQIVSWVEGIESGLPDKTELLSLIKRKSVLANFEHLVISNFTGREAELKLLRDHIDRPPDTSMPLLSIHGPGGIGKSALIGKILYERAAAGEVERMPYIYLAFDQPSLRIDNPVALMSEAASQLELQYPGILDAVQDFKNYIRQYSTDNLEYNKRDIISATRQKRVSASLNRTQTLSRRFAGLLGIVSEYAGRTDQKSKNVLLTLDTFEEVQYRDRESLIPLWNMLETILKFFPLLRIMIAGRSVIDMSSYPGTTFTQIPLGELGMNDRISLLSSFGITDAHTKQLVAERVGGNPLSLRLAARVVIDEQDTGNLNELIPVNWLLFRMDEQLIQGQLYKRVLNHIHNEDVRKLAHPGMVLRKVTPELILTVLAPVCGIAADTPERARALFGELEQEHALVQLGEFDTLRYRSEIRQVMVRLLQQDKFEEVKLLHEKAIEYYYDKDGTEARAEELYHRLALGEDELYNLDQRWITGIEQSIASTLDEYSDRIKAWLASKMSLEVPREVFQNASAIEWERNITRKVKRALLNMDVPDALGLLGERTDKSLSSPLFALEAKAFLLNGELGKADTVLSNGINTVSQSTNRGRLAELFWLKSQIAVMQNDFVRADELLHRAQLAIQQATNPLTLIHILVQRLLLHHTYSVFAAADDAPIRFELSTACFRLNKNQKFVPLFIVQMARAYLAGEYPKTVSRLQEYFPDHEMDDQQTSGEDKDMLVNENLRGLEKYREEWEGNYDDDDEGRQLHELYENVV